MHAKINATICAQEPFKNSGEYTYHVKRVTANTPALTTATACNNAVTGVGATEAAGNQP